MTTSPIVKSLHVLKDRGAGFRPSGKRVPRGAQFRFQRGKETLHYGIVPTIAGTAHRAPNTANREPLLIRQGPVLAPPIRMMEQVSPRACRAPGQSRSTTAPVSIAVTGLLSRPQTSPDAPYVPSRSPSNSTIPKRVLH